MLISCVLLGGYMQQVGNSIKNKRILLAEDCEDSREILKFLFSRSGASVEVVSNGDQCVDQAISALNNKNPFDIIVLDMNMPVLSGIEATKKLREQGYNLPIAAMTGQITEEGKQLSLSSGCNVFMSKLASKESMISTLEALLPTEGFEYGIEFGIPALPIVPTILSTDPEYAPLVIKFINSLENKMEEIGFLIEQHSWKSAIEICSSLSSGSLYGYKIFADRLSQLQSSLEITDSEEINHQYRMLKQSAKSIILGKKEVEKIINKSF